ncbi:MAG TPA: HlyD family secretion protein [Pirellulales bacterium]|jgi:membrane fusion protein (multidrug efflux system)|nr:HlyD family secretion protein [Pirellulales bacterium]
MASSSRESTGQQAAASAASSEGAHAAQPTQQPVAHSHVETAAPPATVPAAAPAQQAAPVPAIAQGKPARRWLLWGIGAVVVLVAAFYMAPLVARALNTVSTDDAYVNSHVTIVAPRVLGQVVEVLVDDNNRVSKGDVLLRLDREPYQVQMDLKQAALEFAQADLLATQDRLRGIVAQARSNRYKLEHAMEDVRNQLELLKSNVAQLNVEQANLALAQRDFERNEPLLKSGAISQQQFDQYRASRDVATNRVKSAEQAIQQTRASLGLSINYQQPLDAPVDLDQTFSTVRQALASLLESVAPLGVVPSTYNGSPKQLIEEFYKRDPKGDLDRIYEKLLKDASPIKQAQSKVHQAQADLDQAALNLRYCEVIAEIDGVVTRRNVNPGNNVQAGQAVMAVRSLTEIWVDANFKETQLSELRIGQPVDLEVDMYGRHRHFAGRITGFTMGTGSTLALLPAQNATGNFVKVVQRLPVRIDFENYNPAGDTLFVGLSVVPYVHYREAPRGPNAGQQLQAAMITRPAGGGEARP